jgi:hypothetical protein
MFALSWKKMFKRLKRHKEFQIAFLVVTYALLTALACSTMKLQR